MTSKMIINILMTSQGCIIAALAAVALLSFALPTEAMKWSIFGKRHLLHLSKTCIEAT